MLGEKTTALGQRDRMGQDRPYIRYWSARDSDEIVADAQQGFPLDLHVGLKQKIEVFHDRAGK
jgi:hypothetical protein